MPDAIVNTKAEAYATKFTTAYNEGMLQIIKQTAVHAKAHMMSSPEQGRLLGTLVGLMQPKYVLEIGTFTGFSALCMAADMPLGSELHTIEMRAEDASTAAEHFKKNQTPGKIILHQGNAKNIIPTLNFNWDLVFIDADKTGYIDYYELTLPRLNRHGLIIADNVLFHGEVLEEKLTGKNAKAIHAFNEHVAADPRVEQVLLTVRDGLMLIKKC